MNTPINIEIAEILFKKHGILLSNISDVVMWLYEKHGIWIDVYYNSKYKSWDYEYTNINWSQEEVDKKLEEDIHNLLDNIFNVKIKYNSPTEAYEAAIEFTLKNLI